MRNLTLALAVASATLAIAGCSNPDGASKDEATAEAGNETTADANAAAGAEGNAADAKMAGSEASADNATGEGNEAADDDKGGEPGVKK
jgi:hypothetical protein